MKKLKSMGILPMPFPSTPEYRATRSALYPPPPPEATRPDPYRQENGDKRTT